jgi:DNA-binding GntR family transcriptional regulator
VIVDNPQARLTTRREPGEGVAGGAGPTSSLPIGPDNVGREPVDRLRDAIVAGGLQPSQRLVEAELTQALGVGRSAVRTALVRLEQEGLVTRERNRGARVRLVDQREAVEILEARSVLEGLIARHAAVRASGSDVADLRDILTEMRKLLDARDLLAVSDRQAGLHRRLVQIADHATAAQLISGLRSQLVRFQYRTILLPGRSEQSFAEHTAIVEAIAAGDAGEAEKAMRAHIAQIAEALRPQGNA